VRRRVPTDGYDRARHVLELGIVLNTYLPGHPSNKTGSDVECDVLLVVSRQLHRNVPVMQKGSGVNSQWPRWIPVPSTRDMADPEGSVQIGFNPDTSKLSRLDDLDGEQVIVGYVRGNNTDPIVMGTLGHSQSKLTPKSREGRLHRLLHQGTAVGVSESGAPFLDIRHSKGSVATKVTVAVLDHQSVDVVSPSGTFSVQAVSDGVLLRHSGGGRVYFDSQGNCGVISDSHRAAVQMRVGPSSLVLEQNAKSGVSVSTLAGKTVQLVETSSESAKGVISLRGSGISVEKDGEELLQIIYDLMQVVEGLTDSQTANPVLTRGSTVIDLVPLLRARLEKIGDLE